MDRFRTCWFMQLLECISSLAVPCPLAKYVKFRLLKGADQAHLHDSDCICVLICLGLVASWVWPFISLVGSLHARMGS